MTCAACNGIGWLYRTVFCTIYKQGTVSVVRRCDVCDGRKWVPQQSADGKLLAAGKD